MNWIKRYFKKRRLKLEKQRLQSNIDYHHNEIQKCFWFSHLYHSDDVRAITSQNIKDNNEKLLHYMKQLKELEK